MNFPRFNSDASALESMHEYINQKIRLSRSQKDFSKIAHSSQLGIDDQDFPYFIGDITPFTDVIRLLPEDIVHDCNQQYNDYFDTITELETKDHLLNVHCTWITTVLDKMALVGYNFTLNLTEPIVRKFITHLVKNQSFYYLPGKILADLMKEVQSTNMQQKNESKFKFYILHYLDFSRENMFAVHMKINSEQKSYLESIVSNF